MSEPENFMSRWSRRKLEPEAKTAAADAAPKDRPVVETADENAGEKTPAGEKPPPFDISTLPSLESIGAQSDVAAFLQAGVPPDLARAALRRAWAADPAIRDFVGLAEYAWDFTAPDSMPGFGPLPPGTDIRQLLADVFGDRPDAAAKPPVISEMPNPQATPAVESSGTGESGSDGIAPHASETGTDREIGNSSDNGPDLVQRTENIATQQVHFDEDDSDRTPVKRHGSALPKI